MKKILCAALMMLIVSCGQKYLETNPVTLQVTDEALATPRGIENAIFPVYDFPRKAFRSPNECLYFIAGTHLVRAGGLLSPDLGMALYNNSLNSTHQPSNDYWRDSYKALNQANAIIGRADKVGFTDVVAKNRVVAEARFFRAYILFYLYQRFEYIPLVTEEVTTPVNTYTVATKAQIFDVITADLQFAVDNLKVASDKDYVSQKGRITKGTAMHLLAKVDLFLQKWSDAAAMATSVINSNEYSLLADRNQLWADNSQNNAEAIYVLEFANNPLDGNDGQIIAPMFTPLIDRLSPFMDKTWFTGGRPWARYYPSQYLLDLFEPADKRLETDYKTVWLYNGSKLPLKLKPKYPPDADSITINRDDTVKTDHWWHPDSINVQYYGPACKKYWEYGSSRTLTDAPCRKSIIRYRLAETYLIAGEAYWRLDNLDSALICFNKVRERAGATPFTALDEKTILDEYARELAFENEDWFTLKRWGKLVEYVRKYSPDSLQTQISEDKIRMPIPQSFLDATPSFVLP